MHTCTWAGDGPDLLTSTVSAPEIQRAQRQPYTRSAHIWIFLRTLTWLMLQATLISSTVLACHNPEGPSINCLERAKKTNFYVAGGDNPSPDVYSFMFYVSPDDCINAGDSAYYLSHISVGSDCRSQCSQQTAAVGGAVLCWLCWLCVLQLMLFKMCNVGTELFVYDNTLSSTHWDWLIPNYVNNSHSKPVMARDWLSTVPCLAQCLAEPDTMLSQTWVISTLCTVH